VREAEGGQAREDCAERVDEGPRGDTVIGDVEVLQVLAEDRGRGGRRGDGVDFVAFEEEVAQARDGGQGLKVGNGGELVELKMDGDKS